MPNLQFILPVVALVFEKHVSAVTGLHLIDVAKAWDKLMLAARILATVDNPADIIAISARPYAQRAVLKFCTYTGAQTVSGRFTPGTFTNQITKQFREPRVLIVGDPRQDHQVCGSPSPGCTLCDGIAAIMCGCLAFCSLPLLYIVVNTLNYELI